MKSFTLMFFYPYILKCVLTPGTHLPPNFNVL